MLKAVICGSCGVGKTMTAMRIQGKPFVDIYKKTHGVDCSACDVVVTEDKEVKLMIWDTTGNCEQAASLTASFYQGADVIILMFDITNQKSFYDLDTVWMNLLRHSIYPNAVPCDKCLVVVGNKADLELQRKVTNTHGKDFAEEIGATFIEISAKTGHNVDALLRHCSIACGHPS